MTRVLLSLSNHFARTLAKTSTSISNGPSSGEDARQRAPPRILTGSSLSVTAAAGTETIKGRPGAGGDVLKKLGAAGIVGILVIVGGIGLIASVEPLIAAGIGLVVAGFGLVLYGLVTNVLASFGMGGMV